MLRTTSQKHSLAKMTFVCTQLHCSSFKDCILGNPHYFFFPNAKMLAHDLGDTNISHIKVIYLRETPVRDIQSIKFLERPNTEEESYGHVYLLLKKKYQLTIENKPAEEQNKWSLRQTISEENNVINVNNTLLGKPDTSNVRKGLSRDWTKEEKRNLNENLFKYSGRQLQLTWLNLE